MDRSRAAATAVLAAVALAALGPLEARAQAVFQFMPGAGEIGTNTRSEWTRYGIGDPTRAFDFTGWFALPVGGTIIGPRFLAWRVTLRPSWRRGSFTGAPEALRGNSLGWSGGLQLMSGRAISISVNGNRNRDVTEGGYGSRGEMFTAALGATLVVRNKWFPMQLGWTRQSNESNWSNQPGGLDFRTAYRTRTYRFSGYSSKLNVDVARTFQDDLIGRASFDSWAAVIGHSLRWGKGSSLESSYTLTDQSGLFPFAQRQWTERLRLQHTQSVYTGWAWRQATTGSGGQTARLRAIEGNLGMRVGPHVGFGLMGGHTRTRFDVGTETAVRIVPRLSFDFGSSRGVRLSVSGGIGYEQRRLVGANEISVPVANESHPVTAARRFTLDQADADPTTVVIRRSDETIIYQEGLDYALAADAGAVRIDILPGGRIQEGETVLVSYRARVPGDYQDKAALVEANVALSLGPVALRHSSLIRRSSLPLTVAGVRGYGEYSNAHTGVDARFHLPFGAFTLSANRILRQRYNDRTHELSGGATLSRDRPGRLQPSIGAFYAKVTTNAITAHSISANAALTWVAKRNLRARFGLEALYWRQGGDAPADRFFGGTVDLEWQLGQIETNCRLEHQRRVNSTSYDIDRLWLRILRRF